ncbi:MAG: lactonase family protein [Ferruginibacter sp.]
MRNALRSIVVVTLLLNTAYAQQNYLLTGTYTKGKSEGIYVYDFNSNTGNSSFVSKIKSVNPSFLAVSPNQHFVYAVNEEGNGKGGKISSYSFNRSTGMLQFINQQLSGGDDPCYVEVDKAGKWVVLANYSGGSLSIFPVENNGSLGEATTNIQHTGSSINKDRQEKAHVHSTFFSPDNKYLLVQDLGMDEITVYPFNEKKGTLNLRKRKIIKSTPGAGPRHIVFSNHHKFVYAIHELSGTVSAYKFKRGKLKLVEEVSASQPGFTGFMGSADIHISGDDNFLYCSNRGDANTISIFKIDKDNGKLTIAGYQSTLGLGPRNFNFDPSGNFLIVANQNSDNIVIFKINKETGLLIDTGKRIDVGSPVCLKWIDK